MATIRFEGVDLYTVADANGDVIDIRFDFTAADESGKMALYAFDKNSNKSDQQDANSTLKKAATKASLKSRIKHLGHWASDAVKKDLSVSYKAIASKKGVKAAATVVGAKSGGFAVKVELLGKGDNVTLSFLVPFDGDKPGFSAMIGVLKLDETDTSVIESYTEEMGKLQSEE